MATEPLSDAAFLLQILKCEAESISRVITLLQQEQGALSQGHTEALPEIVEEKNQLFEQLAVLSTQRNSVLEKQGVGPDRSGIEAWCARQKQQEPVGEAWAELLELATKAKELNRLNGEIIALRMQHTAQALEALRSESRSLSLYGPNGLSTSNGTRRINDSA